MTLTAIVLITVSAFLHAGWNTISKRAHPTTAYFFIALVIGTSLFSPILFINYREILLFPAQVWLLLALTGLCEAIYFISLSAAYRSGDLSIAYPLARSSPVIIVTIITLLLGQSDQFSNQCISGVVLIFTGSIVLPMRHFTDFRLKNYLNLTCLFALCAALGTAGYSIIDYTALKILRETPQITLGPLGIALSYIVVEFFICALLLGLFILFRKERRDDLPQVFRTNFRAVVLTGIAFLLPYTFILTAMAYVSNVSYVVALRQLSIPLGVIFGVMFLKEPRFIPKFIGTAIILTGLFLVAMG